MITKLIWPKGELKHEKNAFWVGCTDDEVIKHIIPRLSGNKEEIIKEIKLKRGPSELEDEQDEKMYCNFFLISADGTDIISYPWVMPHSGLWNASNPFREIDKETITSLNELMKLEERLQSEGRFDIEENEDFPY